MKRAVVFAMVLVIGCVLPVVASARRKASRRERAAVVAAAVAAHDISRKQAPCTGVFVSTVNPRWASLYFPPPTPACEREVADGVSLFHRVHQHWRFVTAGSSFSCPIPGVPRRVARDLRIACFRHP